MKRLPVEELGVSTRREQRYPQLRELHMTYEGTEKSIALHPPDISPRGMFLNTTVQFHEGAVVNLRFRLSRSNFEVRTRGEVRYCLPGVGIGVEFIGIEPEAARAIELEINFALRNRTTGR